MLGSLLLVTLVSMSQTALPDHPPAKYLNAEEAARTSGKRVTVCGQVMSIEHSADPKDPTLFDLDAPASAPILAIVMRPGDLQGFPQLFDKLLIGRQLCLSGSVASIGGRAEMPLKDPDQVVFIGQPPDAPDFGVRTGAVSRYAPGLSFPTVVDHPAPKYTSPAMRARIQGTVTVLAVVGTDGKVKDLRLKTSLDPLYGLDAEALHTAAFWTFKPATRNGEPVNAIATIMLTFSLH